MNKSIEMSKPCTGCYDPKAIEIETIMGVKLCHYCRREVKRDIHEFEIRNQPVNILQVIHSHCHKQSFMGWYNENIKTDNLTNITSPEWAF